MKHEGILVQSKTQSGYSVVTLYKVKDKRNIRVHRLVANAFIPNPDGYTVINHKDENKDNNTVDNLEWCSAEYNVNYGTRNKRASKPILQYDLNGNFIKRWNSGTDITKELKIPSSNITNCCKGKQKTAKNYKWKYEV